MPRSLKRLAVGLTSAAAIAASFALASSPPGLTSASGPSVSAGTTDAGEHLTVKIYEEPVGVGDEPAATASEDSAASEDQAAAWSEYTSAYGSKILRDC
jgi:hypothetical protein